MTSVRSAVQVSQLAGRGAVTRQRPMSPAATSAPAGGDSRPQSERVRLLKRVRDRTDARAWEEFVDEYRPALQAFVRRQGVSATDVPDVVQEILTQLVPAL